MDGQLDLSIPAFHQTRQRTATSVDPFWKLLLETNGFVFTGVDAFAERGFSKAAFSGVVRETHARIEFMLSKRDCDQLLNGLLKPLQIVSEQLVGDCLGDLLTLIDIAAAMSKSNGQEIFSGSVVAGQFTAFKELDEFLSQLGSSPGVCIRSSSRSAAAPVYFFGLTATAQPS